jgi:hypothetical protein
LSPRSTRGFGIRSRRGWLARVKAYQPVGNPAMSSFGNRSRALAVIVRPRYVPSAIITTSMIMLKRLMYC